MADLHIIISEVDHPDDLVERLSKDASDPALAIETIIRELGEANAEFMEVEINGVRQWLS